MATAAQPQRTIQPGTAVATTPKDTIFALIQKHAQDIESLAPRGFTPAHYSASLSLHLRKNPDLLKCDPLTIVEGMLRVAQTGLELGVTCDLLPFVGGKHPVCQFNPRYNGFVELAIQSGVRSINADVVRDDDTLFEFQKGTEFFVRHKRGPGIGRIIWAYAIAEVKQNSFVFEILSRDEIDAVRQQYSKQWKNQPLEQIPWYARKTAIRRLAALLPKNPRFAASLQLDNDIVDGDPPPDVDDAEFEVQGEEPTAASQSSASPESPAPASNGDGELTLEQAMSTPLVGTPGVSWGGQAGKELDSFSTKHLESIQTWCASKAMEQQDPGKQLMVDAIALILADRNKYQTSLKFEEFPVELADEDAAAIDKGIAENEARAAAKGL